MIKAHGKAMVSKIETLQQSAICKLLDKNNRVQTTSYKCNFLLLCW